MTDAAAPETSPPAASPHKAKAPLLVRLAPILALIVGAGVAFSFFGDALSLDALKDNREALVAWRDANLWLAALTFMGVYIAVVAFSIPGALPMTLAGGFLFGTWLGGAMIVVSATIGATLIFLAARTSLGGLLKEKAGAWLQRVEAGFQRGEISFLLLLRLVPAVPFFVANLAPAFLGARFSNYVWTTLVGIAPATFIYASVGAGLGGVLDAGEEPNLGLIFEPHVIGPLLGLAALSTLPLILSALRKTDR